VLFYRNLRVRFQHAKQSSGREKLLWQFHRLTFHAEKSMQIHHAKRRNNMQEIGGK